MAYDRRHHWRRPSRYPVPHTPRSHIVPNEEVQKFGLSICRDGAGICRSEHFFVDERCFHCGAREKVDERP